MSCDYKFSIINDDFLFFKNFTHYGYSLNNENISKVIFTEHSFFAKLFESEEEAIKEILIIHKNNSYINTSTNYKTYKVYESSLSYDKDFYYSFKQKYPNFLSKISFFETSPGWDNLLNKLFKNIENHLNSLPTYLKSEIYATQVKEKFGTLRIYCNQTDVFIDGLITMAESVSSNICESCGGYGVIKKSKWLKCYCEKCNLKI